MTSREEVIKELEKVIYAMPDNPLDENDYMWFKTNLGFTQAPIYVFRHIIEYGFWGLEDGTKIILQ